MCVRGSRPRYGTVWRATAIPSAHQETHQDDERKTEWKLFAMRFSFGSFTRWNNASQSSVCTRSVCEIWMRARDKWNRYCNFCFQSLILWITTMLGAVSLIYTADSGALHVRIAISFFHCSHLWYLAVDWMQTTMQMNDKRNNNFVESIPSSPEQPDCLFLSIECCIRLHGCQALGKLFHRQLHDPQIQFICIHLSQFYWIFPFLIYFRLLLSAEHFLIVLQSNKLTNQQTPSYTAHLVERRR